MIIYYCLKRTFQLSAQRATNLDVCNLGFAPHCYKQPKNGKPVEHATLNKYYQPTVLDDWELCPHSRHSS